MKVLISLDERLVRRIDEKANAKGLSRSAYLAELAQHDIIRGAGARAVALRQLDRIFARAPGGDSTAAIRAERDTRV